MSSNWKRGLTTTVLAACLILTAIPALADNFLDASGTVPGGKGEFTVSGPVAGTPGSRVIRGGCIFYDDRGTFESDNPGLGEYDFENATGTPGGLTGCGSPVDANTNDACFDPGDIPDGVTFQATPNATAGNLLITPGDGTFGSDSQGLVSNTFVDMTEMVFDPPIAAVGADLISYLSADSPNMTVYDGTDTEVGTDTGSSTNASGSFWGVFCPGLIGRVNMHTPSDQAEGFDNVSFGGTGSPVLILSSTGFADQCVDPATNVNGIPEPGEGLTFDLEITALGGDHANISCDLSSASSGVVIVGGSATYPNLLSGESASASYVVLLDPGTTVCGSDIDFDLDCASDQGVFNASFSETVGQALMPDVPASIPDNDPAGVDSDLIVGDDVILADVNVRVEITHTWVGDLHLTLSNSARSVVLLDRPGVPDSGAGCADDNMDVTFDDGAGGDLENHCAGTDPWFVGSADPVGSLADFIGDSSADTWTLTVSDNAGADIGTIDNWELITDPPISGVCNTCGDAGAGFGDPLFDVEIPTLDWVGMVLLFMGLATAAVFILRRRL